MNRASQKYSYVTHPDNLPLELSGKAKKKAIISPPEEYQVRRPVLTNQSRNLILRKMQNNCHKMESNKSVIPTADTRKKSRKNSIKVYPLIDKNNHDTGIAYLMKKTEGKQNWHRTKFHAKEPIKDQAINKGGKKHFVSAQENLKELNQEKKQTIKQTITAKIQYDISANPYRLQRERHNFKKISDTQNLFKSGEELGYQQKRIKKVSDNKMIEMMGCEHVKGGLTEPLKPRRDDWRFSNVTFF